MKPRKSEVQAVADRMVQGHGTPEELAVAVIELIDDLRGERSHRYALMLVAGIPVVVGPYSTDKQARAAVEKAAIADKVIWVHDGWTEEGFKAHMAKVDEPPEPHKVNATEERKREKGFWAHVSRIREGEATAIVGHGKQDIEIKPFQAAEGGLGMRALDLFAGAGGWDLAAKRLGIHPDGVEIMREANETRVAAGLETVGHDVWNFDLNVGRDYDGLIASPPCQTFSLAGKGKGREALDKVLGLIDRGWDDIADLRQQGEALGDDRTALVLTPLHYAYEMRPEWIAWEQVPTVLPVWEACADQLFNMGYSVWTGNLQAEQYGVPQTRKRAFLLASRTREVSRPEATHSRYYPRSPERLDEGVKKWISMAEALGWVEDGLMVSNYGTGGDSQNRGVRLFTDPAPTVTSHINRNRLYADEGGANYMPVYYRSTTMPNSVRRRLDLPAPTIAFGHDANSARWVRAESDDDRPEWCWGRPSTTIVGSFKPEIVAAPGYRTTISRQNAPDSVRVTVQEAGILQSFPADHPWQGAKGKQYLQVGNAVPPLLAEAVLSAVAS